MPTPARSRTGKIIVALQMALCVVLLVGAGLLIRTLRNLENTPLGMQVDGLVVFGVNPNIPSIPEGVRLLPGTDRASCARLPGVESVTVMEERLGSGWSDNSDMMVDGKLPDVANGASRTVRSNVAGPDFFTTLGVPVLAGRDFADSDTATSPHVGIINEEFAQRFLPNQNPLGHTIGTDDGRYQMTIVGVVKNHKYRSIDEEPIPMAWYMYAQIPMIGPMDVEMRVHGDAAGHSARRPQGGAADGSEPAADSAHDAARAVRHDHLQPDALCAARRVLRLLAVVLVATGLYGTLAYRVNMRTAEIGVRMAVGARRDQVVWMILKDSLVLTAVGVVIGIPLAMLVGRALASSLYGVKALDAVSYLLAVGGVAVVALAASTVPASPRGECRSFDRAACGIEPGVSSGTPYRKLHRVGEITGDLVRGRLSAPRIYANGVARKSRRRDLLVSFPYNRAEGEAEAMTTRREFLALASLVASGAVLDKAGATATGAPTILSGNGTGEDLTQFVNIFCGTGGHRHCFPGATVPFGAVQLSPDTGFDGWDWCSGYHHDDSVLIGFSHTHLSGTGCGDLLDVLLVPRTGDVVLKRGTDETARQNPAGTYRSRFSHADEQAAPGYYAVLTETVSSKKIKTELTATERTGLAKFTFPEGEPAHILLDWQHGYGETKFVKSAELESR